MRIQHNIMAMNAYRNYNRNTSALSKNLERLSSGYKINRAGDDAAGLAISEKMRAQITGLDAAQKNVKDGISLVNTAEGAMQEIQDMLNRMVYLATQSANGTYDDAVDRKNLQAEVDQLREEINRIADSANFNGTKLLDGSLEKGGGSRVTKGIDRILKETLAAGEDPIEMTGEKTILDGGNNSSQATKFDVDFSGLKKGEAAGDEEPPAGGGTPSEIGGAGAQILVNGNNTQVAAGTGLKDAIDALANADTIADGSAINVEYSGGAWKVSVGGEDLGTITATDDNAGKLTLTDAAGNELLTITGTNNEAEADYQGALGTATATGLTYTPAKAPAPGARAATITPPTATAITQVTAGAAGANAVYSFDLDDLDVDAACTLTLTVGGKSYDVEVTDAEIANKAANPLDDVIAGKLATAMNADPVTDATAGDYTAAATGSTITLTAANQAAVTTDLTAGGIAVAEKPAAPGPDAGTSTIDFKIGGEVLAEDIEVEDDATAEDIANAVFEALGGDATAGTDPVEVTLNGAKWNVTCADGKLSFELTDAPTAENIKGNFDWDVTGDTGSLAGNHTAGTVVTQAGQVGAANAVANTVFEITEDDIKDGSTITLDGKTVTLAVGPNSQYKDGANVVDLTGMDPQKIDLDKALGKISEAFKDGTTNFTVGVNDTKNGDGHKGLTVHKKDTSTQTYDTVEKLASVFSIATAADGDPLTLQIGDSSDSYNQLAVSVGDMHVDAMIVEDPKTGAKTSIADIDISNQKGAQAAVDVIKGAINYVSSVRGNLGAISNRLDHTANNLSVMAENIQDAESTIRDTDIANEMMSYTKNNILVQSAQAMLAQANQVPQGVLQLLQ